MTTAMVTGASSTALTLAQLQALSQTSVELPGLSAKAGRPIAFTVRWITPDDWRIVAPASIPGSETWARDEYEARRQAWLREQSQDALYAYHAAWRLAEARICALGCVAPVLSEHDALGLGDDLHVLARAILRHSGLLTEDPAPAAPTTSEESAP